MRSLARFSVILVLVAVAGCKAKAPPVVSATGAPPAQADSFDISQTHEGLTRTINVKVRATPSKLNRVQTLYDGFVLGDDRPNPNSSSYERMFKQTQGVTPNQPHTVIVNAWHADGSSDSGRRTWTD